MDVYEKHLPCLESSSVTYTLLGEKLLRPERLRGWVG
jgi:hypothetical protein